jgi:dynein heavy chain, axonemal
LLNIFKGVLLSVPEAVEDLAAMKRLWVHEVLRVFVDRMQEKSDRDWVLQVIRETCSEKLGNEFDAMFQEISKNNAPVSNIKNLNCVNEQILIGCRTGIEATHVLRLC